jgi:hypothetical protein
MYVCCTAFSAANLLCPPTHQDYEAMPVEEFGKALLRGLGWADGQGVGRKRQVRGRAGVLQM